MTARKPLTLFAVTVVGTAFLMLTPAAAQAGYAVANDFDCDGKSDVVYTDPDATVNSAERAGLIAVRLSSNGFGLEVSQDSPGMPGASEAGDGFGFAVASFDQDSDGCADLLVGAPFEDLGSRTDAGLVWIIPGGLAGFDFSAARTYSQDSPGFAGVAEAFDRFGYSLTASRTATGTPFWAAGSPGDHYNDDSGGTDWGRGMVYYVRGGKATVIHYAKPGVPGTPHPNQDFGRVLSSTPYHLIVGVPQMGFHEYGAISVFGHTFVDGLPEPMGNFHQDSSGITGAREYHDNFGETLDAVPYQPADANPGSLVAVGVPNEDMGGDEDAGLAHVLFITKAGRVTEKMAVHQGLFEVWGTADPDDWYGRGLSLTTVGGVMGTSANSVLNVPPNDRWSDGSPTEQLFKVSVSPGARDVVVHGGVYGLPQWTWGYDIPCARVSPDGLLMALRNSADEPERPVVYFVPWANIREGASLPVWSWEPSRTGPTPQAGWSESCGQLL